jgi:CrcB protein
MNPDDPFGVARAQADVDPDLVARPRRGRARHTDPMVLTMIALGGILGTLCRYWVSRVVHVAPESFPWATFTVNISGAFVLGLLLTLVIERWPPSRYVRPFFAIGFLGAYTTFSTYMVEIDLLVKDGAGDVAALYLVGSLLAGLVAVYLGIVAGRLAPRSRGG